jgi:eukaryotic-like serine/threonine-protein kinase
MIRRDRIRSESRVPTTPGAKLAGTVEAPSRWALGAVLEGKYRLDRILGVGAMGSVFAATHLRNGNRVAVKLLHPAVHPNSDGRLRFLREGYAANSVRHAGTVRVLDDGVADDGALFLVMDLLEGETLQSLWERGGRVPPRDVAQLMWQVLDILSAAHENGIVHRDVKPENLFVERDGTLRILDFGVARLLEGTLIETRAGSIIGTLPYMAPEQMLGRNREVDARSDVWSVGATAFTLISGHFVHDAETPEEMLVFTASRQALSLARVAPRTPRAIVDVVDRALRFDKRERWASAKAMQAALAEAYRCTQPTDERLEDDAGDRSTPRLAGRENVRFGRSLPETMRHRLGVALSRGAWVRSPVAAASQTTPSTRLVVRWARAGAVALAVVGATMLAAHGAGRSPRAGASRILVQTAAPSPPLVSPVVSVVAAGYDAGGTPWPSIPVPRGPAP